MYFLQCFTTVTLLSLLTLQSNAAALDLKADASNLSARSRRGDDKVLIGREIDSLQQLPPPVVQPLERQQAPREQDDRNDRNRDDRDDRDERGAAKKKTSSSSSTRRSTTSTLSRSTSSSIRPTTTTIVARSSSIGSSIRQSSVGSSAAPATITSTRANSIPSSQASSVSLARSTTSIVASIETPTISPTRGPAAAANTTLSSGSSILPTRPVEVIGNSTISIACNCSSIALTTLTSTFVETSVSYIFETITVSSNNSALATSLPSINATSANLALPSVTTDSFAAESTLPALTSATSAEAILNLPEVIQSTLIPASEPTASPDVDVSTSIEDVLPSATVAPDAELPVAITLAASNATSIPDSGDEEATNLPASLEELEPATTTANPIIDATELPAEQTVTPSIPSTNTSIPAIPLPSPIEETPSAELPTVQTAVPPIPSPDTSVPAIPLPSPIDETPSAEISIGGENEPSASTEAANETAVPEATLVPTPDETEPEVEVGASTIPMPEPATPEVELPTSVDDTVSTATLVPSDDGLSTVEADIPLPTEDTESVSTSNAETEQTSPDDETLSAATASDNSDNESSDLAVDSDVSASASVNTSASIRLGSNTDQFTCPEADNTLLTVGTSTYITDCNSELRAGSGGSTRNRQYAVIPRLTTADECAAACSANTNAPLAIDGSSSVCIGFAWLDATPSGTTYCTLWTGQSARFREVPSLSSDVSALSAINIQYWPGGR